MYAKDPYEAKYQYSINVKKVGLNRFNDPKPFIKYSNDMKDFYKNIDEYNTDKERKILIVFDMIADTINDKKLNSVVTELFIIGRKLHISLAFITQSYFKVPKDVRPNSTHFFIMKIPNKGELQQIALIIHQLLALKISLRFTKNVLLDHILFWLMMLCFHQIID